MDQNRSEDQILSKLINNKQFLIRTLQFVLSISVFSVFLWYSSGFSIHPQSFNAYFSTCLFSMITHTLERKYMFLICNGILAFVAKTSLMNSSSDDSTSDSGFHQIQLSNMSETKETTVSDVVVVLLGSSESSENVPLVVEEQKCHEEYNGEVSEADTRLCSKTDQGRESEGCIGEEDEIIEGESESEIEVAQEEEDDDDELEGTSTITPNEELVNTEELNRKFEEFIRKMKEEIRIEAQTQLIAV